MFGLQLVIWLTSLFNVILFKVILTDARYKQEILASFIPQFDDDEAGYFQQDRATVYIQ